MAKNTLLVDFQDDIMNSSMGGNRRYKMINNSDGTVSFEDATTYDQVGSNFGAGQMNATNAAVNEAADKNKVIQDLDAIRNVTEDGYIAGALALKQVEQSLVNENAETFNFGILDGKRGFFTDSLRGADSFVPFNVSDYSSMVHVVSYSSAVSSTYKCVKDTTAIIVVLGTQYLGTSTVTINGTNILNKTGSTDIDFMQLVDLKAGDSVSIYLNSGSSVPAYSLLACVLHNSGIY